VLALAVQAACDLAMRILIVDDDPDILLLLEDVLLSRGHDVLWATSPDDGLGILDVADAVITDLVMPGQCGLAFASEIRRRYPTMPIAFSTGCHPDCELAKRAGRLGAVLHKPWTFQQVEATVTDMAAAVGAGFRKSARGPE
jgi:DNA-binding response OmpR family regulator